MTLCLCGESISMIHLYETSVGVTFAVKVHPHARKNGITGELGDALKVSLTAPPLAGRANEACIEFFASVLKVSRSSITIASGETSRRKMVRVKGLSAEDVRQRLHSGTPDGKPPTTARSRS